MGVWSLPRPATASLPRVTDCFQWSGIKTAPDTRGCLCRPLMTASRLFRQCYMASEPPSPSGQGPEPLRVSAMSSFTNTGLVHFCMVTFSPPEARPRFCVQGNGATPAIVAHFAGCCTAELVGCGSGPRPRRWFGRGTCPDSRVETKHPSWSTRAAYKVSVVTVGCCMALPWPLPVYRVTCRRRAQDSNMLEILVVLADELVGDLSLVYALKQWWICCCFASLGTFRSCTLPTSEGMCCCRGSSRQAIVSLGAWHDSCGHQS